MKKKKISVENVERFFPDENVGLGLSQIELRNEQGLRNKSTVNYSKTYFKIFIKNICTFFNLLCLICALALAVVKADIGNFTFVVVFGANIFIGIFQEIKAKITLDKLSIVSTPTANVMRNGKREEIPVSDIVLDDIIILELGNQISADCVMLSGNAEINESMLTGESVPVKKQVGDQLFAGSFVAGGSCVCRVDKVGDDCYVEQLSMKAKKHKNPNSKLLGSINAIIKTIGILIFPIGGVMAFINYTALSSGGMAGFELIRTTVTKTVTVIIGMIPSGMFLLTTMALFVGIIKLAKVNTNVQDMYSIEMLARVDVLCLDKTGTITDGRMSVTQVVELNPLEGITISDAIYATEHALKDQNQTADALRAYFKDGPKLTALQVIPFSSARKLSAVTFDKLGTFVIGAPNFIFEKISDTLETEIKKYAMTGSRVLMLAHSSKPINGEELPKNLEAIALIVIEDNIRPEAIETIRWFRENEVQVKVISGDDPITVSEISKRAGIKNASNYINLSGLKEAEILNIADKYTVFGRVSPEQKAILVRALKNCGHTVAMTGDGVNDILAMKEADCSVTVASGSGASKSVAHLVLMDNNFNSIPKAVTEGRRVINNIQQSASLFLVKTVFTLTFALISILSMSEYPFEPRMMVMFEVFIIGFPSFFLSLQPNDKRVRGNFITEVLSDALPGALMLFLNVFIVNIITKSIGISISPEIAESMLVVILTFGGLVFLIKLCTPADLYKGLLVFAITLIQLIWVVFLMDTPFFGLASFSPLKDNWQYVLILVCIIQFDYPLLSLFMKITDKIKNSIGEEPKTLFKFKNKR